MAKKDNSSCPPHDWQSMGGRREQCTKCGAMRDKNY